MGIPEPSLFNWIVLHRAGMLADGNGVVSATPRSAEDLEAEVNRLRRELASVKLDNDLLIGPCRYRLQPVDVMIIRRDGTGSHQM